MLLVGPPAVGKTAFKRLLFNWEPPHHHHSTGISDRPIRAVERVATVDGMKNWEMVNTKEVMKMLAEDIRVQASINNIKFPQHSQPSVTRKEAHLSIIENVSGKEAPHPDVPRHSMSLEPSSLMSGEEGCMTPLAFTSNNEKETNEKSKIKKQSEDALPEESCCPSPRIENVVKVVDSSVEPSNKSASVESNTIAEKIAKNKSILHLSKDILTAMKGIAT